MYNASAEPKGQHSSLPLRAATTLKVENTGSRNKVHVSTKKKVSARRQLALVPSLTQWPSRSLGHPPAQLVGLHIKDHFFYMSAFLFHKGSLGPVHASSQEARSGAGEYIAARLQQTPPICAYGIMHTPSPPAFIIGSILLLPP